MVSLSLRDGKNLLKVTNFVCTSERQPYTPAPHDLQGTIARAFAGSDSDKTLRRSASCSRSVSRFPSVAFSIIILRSESFTLRLL
jgi:hypothetical protein